MFPPRIRVAIIGGGMAGASLANALVGMPHIDVHIYESASEFAERGAAVGLSSNAKLALEELIPSSAELLNRAGAVPMNSTRLVLVSSHCKVMNSYSHAEIYLGIRQGCGNNHRRSCRCRS
jgi:hypothetical protein